MTKKDIFGASDPYVAIFLANKDDVREDFENLERQLRIYGDLLTYNTQTYIYTNEIRRTSTIKSTLNPIWNEMFEIQMNLRSQSLVLDVFDENRLTRDDFLGRVTLLDVGRITPGSHLLNKRSTRSNVSGTLDLDCAVVYDSEDVTSESECKESFILTTFHKLIDVYNLKPVLEILTNGLGYDQMKVSVLNEAEMLWTGEAFIIPLTLDTESKLRQSILKFFFNDDKILDWNLTEEWKKFINGADKRLCEKLMRKIQVNSEEELKQISVRMTSHFWTGVTYIEQYKTLIVPQSTNHCQTIVQTFYEMLNYWVSISPAISSPPFSVGASAAEGSLTIPNGWESRTDLNGRTLYYDHENRRVTLQRLREACF